MTLPKALALVSIVLFGLIGTIAIFKKSDPILTQTSPPVESPLEIELDTQIQAITPAIKTSNPLPSVPPLPAAPPPPSSPPFTESRGTVAMTTTTSPAGGMNSPNTTTNQKYHNQEPLPEANRIEEFFNKHDPKFPIVETITYTSNVPWLKGRPAWLSDYASHYNTSRHFIARSLNGKPDYFKQELAKGDKFNVLSDKKNFEFYLLVDTSRCKVWFYYIDLDLNKKVLIKTYAVSLGRLDSGKASGLLTPLGKYTLGSRIAVYKPKMMGTFRNKKTEMITVFGTRWIPFDKEIGECTAPAKSFGIHGTPWTPDSNGLLVDNTSSIGKYESDGCIRFATPDIEELYAIVITKPTTIEIVKDFYESSLKKMKD